MILVIKHVSIEGPGTIGDFFKDTNWQLETIELERGDKLPDDIRDIEAIITLGGFMNVYEEDKYPFLKDEDIFLRKAIKKEIPILGICLGGQLLAKALGAKVKKAAREEIGWGKVNLTKQGLDAPLFSGLEQELDVFQWHGDTFQIPGKGTLLATSKYCKNQAFLFGKNTYGLQFHIEVTPGMIESWIKEYLDTDDQTEMIDRKRMVIEAHKRKDRFRKQADRILSNFLRLIAERKVAVGR